MNRQREIGACLRAVRLASKRGLRATANVLGVAHPTLVEWESGARPIPAAHRAAIVVVFPMMAPVFEAYDVCPACGLVPVPLAVRLAQALGGTQADDDVVHAYVQSRKKRKAQI